jgi:hypothetical protein
MAWPNPLTAPLVALCKLYLREPQAVTDDVAGTTTYVFTPALSPAEQATFADLQIMAAFGVTVTLAEWQAIKADAANLKTFYALPAPTQAQAVAAVKSIIHVLSVIVRN